jgi:hypothetical protein
MESGTFSAIPAPQRQPKYYASGPGGFIRDVGGRFGPCAGTNQLRRRSRYSQRRQPVNQQRLLAQRPPIPPLELGGRSILGRGLRRRERTLEAANKSRELAARRRCGGRKSARSGASACPAHGCERASGASLPGEPSLLERIAKSDSPEAGGQAPRQRAENRSRRREHRQRFLRPWARMTF